MIKCSFDKLDYTISFIDFHILKNILRSIRDTFNPHNIEPLEQRIVSRMPKEHALGEHFSKLEARAFRRSMCTTTCW